MAVKDLRAPVLAGKPKNPTSGKRLVSYIDAKGRSMDAVVLAAGTSSGLKLYLSHYSPGNQVKDNVPAQATINSTLCYIART